MLWCCISCLETQEITVESKNLNFLASVPHFEKKHFGAKIAQLVVGFKKSFFYQLRHVSKLELDLQLDSEKKVFFYKVFLPTSTCLKNGT